MHFLFYFIKQKMKRQNEPNESQPYPVNVHGYFRESNNTNFFFSDKTM